MFRWRELTAMLAERRVGFRIDEEMKGTHRFARDFPAGEVEAGAELPLEFSATWGAPRLERFLNPLGDEFLLSLMDGAVTAGGLCREAPMEGTLALRYFRDATVRYTFEFSAHDSRYRYLGEKRDIRPWNLHRTHTICYGTITDLGSGAIISDSVVHFDLARLPGFLGSLRLR